MSNIRKAIDIASGRVEASKPEPKVPDAMQELARQSWLASSFTKKFLSDLEQKKTEYLIDAQSKAISGGSSKSLRKQLIRAQNIEEILNYARGNTSQSTEFIDT